MNENETNVILATGISPGVAVGPVLFLNSAIEGVPRRTLAAAEVSDEVARFHQGLKEAEEEFRRQAASLKGELSESETRIFQAHVQLYQDEVLRESIATRIADQKLNAEAAIADEVEHFTQILAGMDSLFRERAADIRDVGNRINRVLLNRAQESLKSGTEPFVLYARELLPSDTMQIDRPRLLAIVTEVGGFASHVAILARAFEIPAVTGVQNLERFVRPGTVIAVDGHRGAITLTPSRQQRSSIAAARKSYLKERHRLHERATQVAKAELESGISVLLNIENFEALDPQVLATTRGIGLYRTEFLFMGRTSFPSEEEQYEFYKGVLERVGGRQVTFRTLDVGADKPLSYLSTPREQNPVLGWRGIRLTFEWPDLLIPQLRALLRASAHGELRIMLPMVTNVEELRHARELLDRLRTDLEKQGHAVAEMVPMGAMIEVPAAAMAAADLAQEAEFLSVGTNDLGQYFFAVDRNNLQVAKLYQPLHPAMLRLLAQIIEAAKGENKEITVCGEMAGEPLSVLALLGLGLKNFSMSPAHVPDSRVILQIFEPNEAEELLSSLLELKREKDVVAVLAQAIKERTEAAGIKMPLPG